ncbi:MAG: TolC family protein, partial [Bacteroidota bacterium]
MSIRFMLCTIWLLVYGPSFSQESVLEGYISQGLENNSSFLREQLNTKIQEEVVKEANGNFLPNIFFDASYTLADGGRTINVPAGDLVNPIYRALNQTTGSDQFPTDIANVSEQFLPNNFHETKIRLIQPILNTSIHHNYRIQTSMLSSQEAKQKALENQLIKQIKMAYYNHLSAKEQLSILTQTREILEELLSVSQKLVQNNKATKDRIYGSKAELSRLESRIAQAETQYNTSRDFFNYLLNRGLDEPILTDEALIDSEWLNTDLSELQVLGLAKRSELAQLNYGLAANEASVKLNKGYIIPDINVVADAGFQGFEYTFDQNQDFWFLRFGLTWPIFKGGQNKSKIQQSILRKEQIQSNLDETKKLIALEISEAFYSYKEALKTLEASQS